MLWFWLWMEYASDLARGILSKKRCLNAAFLSGFCSEMFEVLKVQEIQKNRNDPKVRWVTLPSKAHLCWNCD